MSNQRTERKAHLEQVRAEQLRKDRQNRVRVAAAAATVVVLVAGATVWAVRQVNTSEPASTAASSPIAGLLTFTNLAREHVNGTVTYEQSPPVGGNHSPVWQNCGWYETPVANENAVHSLEHAAAWVTYRSDLSSADLATLKSELAGKPYVLASAYPGLSAPVVATAWGHQVKLDGVHDPRLAQFVSQYANSPSAPEPGGECSGGVGSPA